MDKYVTITINATLTKGAFNNQETKQGIFRGKAVNRTYETFSTDKEQLALDITDACNEYANQGYELVSSTPIQNGIYNYDTSMDCAFGYGVSVTSGVVLTFKNL